MPPIRSRNEYRARSSDFEERKIVKKGGVPSEFTTKVYESLLLLKVDSLLQIVAGTALSGGLAGLLFTKLVRPNRQGAPIGFSKKAAVSNKLQFIILFSSELLRDLKKIQARIVYKLHMRINSMHFAEQPWLFSRRPSYLVFRWQLHSR